MNLIAKNDKCSQRKMPSIWNGQGYYAVGHPSSFACVIVQVAVVADDLNLVEKRETNDLGDNPSNKLTSSEPLSWDRCVDRFKMNGELGNDDDSQENPIFNKKDELLTNSKT
uniref:Uncharacterized protein n=1 Tax=Romanomermis culicivorax TaxID=13658 RepID=A0A915JN89_ROMCU